MSDIDVVVTSARTMLNFGLRMALYMQSIVIIGLHNAKGLIQCHTHDFLEAPASIRTTFTTNSLTSFFCCMRHCRVQTSAS